MPPFDKPKAKLQARQAALLARIGGISEELVSHQEKDWEDMALQRESEEVLETLGREAQAEVRAIQLALERIETGDYGHCQVCGAPISAARLEILPDTPFCKDCAP